MPSLTHLDDQGNARMVDVTSKDVTERRATAMALVRLSEEAFRAVCEGSLKKGDVFTVARIAGIMGAKQTSALIPLCHPLPLTGIEIDIIPDATDHSIRIHTSATITARTGVEMEALTAASIAALTIYDMCKGIDKGIVIEGIRLLSKEGGASGTFHADVDQ